MSTPGSSTQPVTFGLPFGRGVLPSPDHLYLENRKRERHLVQAQPLRHWSDGSIQWLLLDTILPAENADSGSWSLCQGVRGSVIDPALHLEVEEFPHGYVVHTGSAIFHLDRSAFPPISQAVMNGQEVLAPGASGTRMIDRVDNSMEIQVLKSGCTVKGPVRASFVYEGAFGEPGICRFVGRICFFAGTGLVRIDLTIHNPRRAKHPGNLWDLGDPGSLLFNGLTLDIGLRSNVDPLISWSEELASPSKQQKGGSLEIYQDSSGGENWQSRNHVNRNGEVPLSFRGYRSRSASDEEFGERASPVVTLSGDQGCISAAIPEFWQQFPKSIEVDGKLLRLGFFPGQHDDFFELQGGEKKTHKCWLHFASPEAPTASSLAWVHQPVRIHAPSEWSKASVVFPSLGPTTSNDAAARLETYLREMVEGPASYFARREIIDEYGWRNFGEIFADHEGEHYSGPPPVISHFNNQYDQVYGFLLQYLRTGDVRWFDLFDALARHVMDIDLYHTNEDRSAYNGGMFWLTDHYVSAETATHRTYSGKNCGPNPKDYGGGPSSNHVFATGLLHYYYMTGDTNARNAVVQLADWIIQMDDGRTTIFGIVDEGPTGLASMTVTPDYQGPGRGGANATNALLDGWLATGNRGYLDKAEELIQRCIHPNDDIATRNLEHVETRWSYTMYLSMLARYLDLKAEAGELDFCYAYARESVLHYARWMLENERPYFDHPEDLEYPTETWAGQELRKGNVLRLAALHADEPLRSRLIQRGTEFADRAWSDLMRFQTKHSARAAAIFMVEGVMDVRLQGASSESRPGVNRDYEFGQPQSFTPQKQRVIQRLKSVSGMALTILQLANPKNWWRLLKVCLGR
ncbi:MAG: hypothetical protein ACFCD0_12065 [Gemmataceae bacterium]